MSKKENVLKRDKTGECEPGEECRDRVHEGEAERQADIEKDETKSPEEYPNAPGAKKRKTPPGGLGGKV